MGEPDRSTLRGALDASLTYDELESERDRLATQLYQASEQLADARHELDVLRGQVIDLNQRLDLALTDLSRALRERDEARAERDRRSDELRRAQGVIKAATVRAQVLRDLREFGSGADGWAERDRISDAAIVTAIDALTEREEVTDASP